MVCLIHDYLGNTLLKSTGNVKLVAVTFFAIGIIFAKPS